MCKEIDKVVNKPLSQREIDIVEMYFSGMTQSEIARQIKANPSTVYRTLRRPHVKKMYFDISQQHSSNIVKKATNIFFSRLKHWLFGHNLAPRSWRVSRIGRSDSYTPPGAAYTRQDPGKSQKQMFYNLIFYRTNKDTIPYYPY